MMALIVSCLLLILPADAMNSDILANDIAIGLKELLPHALHTSKEYQSIHHYFRRMAPKVLHFHYSRFEKRARYLHRKELEQLANREAFEITHEFRRQLASAFIVPNHEKRGIHGIISSKMQFLHPIELSPAASAALRSHPIELSPTASDALQSHPIELIPVHNGDSKNFKSSKEANFKPKRSALHRIALWTWYIIGFVAIPLILVAFAFNSTYSLN